MNGLVLTLLLCLDTDVYIRSIDHENYHHIYSSYFLDLYSTIMKGKLRFHREQIRISLTGYNLHG